MKFTSIFFAVSAGYLRILFKDSNKRTKNMKFTSIFFAVSAGYLRILFKGMKIDIKQQQKIICFLTF